MKWSPIYLIEELRKEKLYNKRLCFWFHAHISQSLARVDRDGEEDDEEESLYQATKF